jgi:hypothetical protein
MQQLLNPKRELQRPSWQASLDADSLTKTQPTGQPLYWAAVVNSVYTNYGPGEPPALVVGVMAISTAISVPTG